MKIIINGNKFDTSKAEKHYNLEHFDGRNHITGDLFKSSKGKWYMWLPSQWGREHSHVILTTPTEVLEKYRDWLDDESIEEISQYIDGWE